VPAETEATFLNVQHDRLRGILQTAGAQLQHPMTTMQRTIMDFPHRPLMTERDAWVRVRDEGPRGIFMAYKEIRNPGTVDGVEEIEVQVGDFPTAQGFLEKLGLSVFGYHETRREIWQAGDVEVSLDEWPWVRPSVDVEGSNPQLVEDVSAHIGLPWDRAVFGGAETIYKAEFDITDEQFRGIGTITFDTPVPDWLARRRRIG
jgi:adenylate cyclase class IV